MANKLIALLGVILATTAQAQENEDETTAKTDTRPQCAFGYCMGQAIDEEPEGKTDDGLLYVEHDLRVTALLTNSAGVCAVLGIYHVPSPDRYGNAHREAFNMLSDYVKSTYGEPTGTIDRLWYGSKRDEPKYWLKTLKKGERTLKSYWTKEPSILPPGLAIVVKAQDHSVSVSYQFANYVECMDENRSVEAELDCSEYADIFRQVRKKLARLSDKQRSGEEVARAKRQLAQYEEVINTRCEQAAQTDG